MKRLIFAMTMALFFVSTAVAQDELTTFIMVRHAEKANDGTNNPGLTEEGAARADRLKAVLSASEISGVYSSPFKRTINTAKPLATDLNLEIKEYNPRGTDWINTLLSENKGKTILVSGHSNTTPVAVNFLLGEKKFEWLSEDEYDKIFIVTVSSVGKGTVTVLTY